MGSSLPALAQNSLVQGTERLMIYQQKDEENDRIPPKLSAEPLVLNETQSTVNLLENISAVDDREGELTLAVEGYDSPTKVPLEQLKNGTQKLLYTATDKAGNVGYLYRSVTVRGNKLTKENEINADKIAPEVISAPLYVLAGSLDFDTFVKQKENITAYDNQEGDLSYKFRYIAEHSQLDLTRAGHYLVEWQVTDAAHNKAIVKQWVVVVE